MFRAVALSTVFSASGEVSEKCQAKMDTWCTQQCYPLIKDRPCDGPMYARHSGPSGDAWRCYSPSTLSGNTTFHSGTCYCTRDSDLSGILDDCNSGIVSSRVFQNGVPSGVCYRIPAVVKTTSGALVAFAESRHGGCGDGQVREIAVSRSADNGQTWSAVTYAVTQPTSTGNVGNPMPFALSDGRVALTYVYRNNGGAAVGTGDSIVFSSDDGLTWTKPQDISDGFGSAKGSMPGPGAGIQLQDSGRLLIVSHYGAYVDDYVTYSDDFGETWATVDHKFPKMDEATMADLGGGEVLLNFRHQNEKSQGRGVSRSSDGGLTWSDISYDSALKGPVCQGSLAAIGSSVYFSNPASTSGRNHLTVKKSDDGGHSWPSSYLIQASSSAGYSSLVQGSVGDENSGGIVYESSDSGCIDFKTFPLAMQHDDMILSAVVV